MDGVEGMEGMEGMEGEMENAEDMGGEMENAEDMEGDMDAMDGEMDNAEGMEGEDGMDEMGGEEATLANDASAADLGTEGTLKSPKKSKKKGSPSKTVKKKVKDPNEIKVLEYKKSDKTKRWVVNEKSLDVPEDI